MVGREPIHQRVAVELSGPGVSVRRAHEQAGQGHLARSATASATSCWTVIAEPASRSHCTSVSAARAGPQVQHVGVQPGAEAVAGLCVSRVAGLRHPGWWSDVDLGCAGEQPGLLREPRGRGALHGEPDMIGVGVDEGLQGVRPACRRTLSRDQLPTSESTFATSHWLPTLSIVITAPATSIRGFLPVVEFVTESWP